MNSSAVLPAFRFLPFPHEVVARFRKGMDDGGQPVVRIAEARGGESLRDQLRRAGSGEPILLAAFSPFSIRNPYREIGPVFLRAELPSLEEPEIAWAPDPCAYFRATVASRAYGTEERIHDPALVEPEGLPAQVARFLEDPAVWFVDTRMGPYGCFACRIRRTDSCAFLS